jgi:2-(1,2-epoxy-1,2-dihydrophenyl)acetyl-CoA isomerase
MGYSPDGGGTWLLPRLIGLDQAKRFVYTGEFWSAAEARARGLITEVHAAEQLGEAVQDFAAKLAVGPTVALGQAKQLMQAAAGRTLREQLVMERKAGEICAASDDAKEAMTAAVERRPPAFTGR